MNIATTQRLQQQLAFLIEIDKLKHIFRKTKLFDSSRFENDAEHAWHLCLMVMVFAEYANTPIDASKVLKMLLIHDLVEINSGDVLVYDTAARNAVQVQEQAAAQRIFGLLPDDQQAEFMALWQEFEERATSEARFAAAVDRFEPLLQNHLTEHYTWKAHGITATQLHERNAHIAEGSETIWQLAQNIFGQAIEQGSIV